MESLKAVSDIEEIERSLSSRWAWFVLSGIILLVLSIFAFSNLVTATTVSVLYIGVIMTFGGLVQILHSFQVKKWSSFLFFMFGGLLYGAAGILSIQNPLLAAVTLTLMFAYVMIASGALRTWAGFKLQRQNGKTWMVISGLITFVAGVVFLLEWPFNTVFLLGLILAIDLSFQSVATISFGLAMRRGKPTTNRFLGKHAFAH